MIESKLYDQAIAEAKVALNEGNYPIGAVIVDWQGNIVAAGHNQNTTSQDITAHAEMLCLRLATQKVLSKDLPINHTIITTEEPCGGCGFFIARTNINKIIWLLTDPHRPGVSLLKNQYPDVFSKIEFISEPDQNMKEQSRNLMHQYFLQLNRPELAKMFK